MRRSLFFLCVLILIQHVMAAQSTAAAPPVAKISVIQPQPDQQVTGCMGLRITLDVSEGAKAPTVVYAGFGGTPWTQLKQGDKEWTAPVDSTLVPNGTQKLVVLTDDSRVSTSINLTVQNPLKVWFADLHAHTSYSDGTLIPAVAYDYARRVAKLDVFSLTDHETNDLEFVDDNEWLDTREAAWKANEDGRFVAITGLEWSKEWGHVNIFDPKVTGWPDDPAQFYKAAAGAGVILKFNHPGDGTVSHGGLEYSEIGAKAVKLMEVRDANEEKAFIRALKHGWRLAPDGSSDEHLPKWGTGPAWTGILAPGLSKVNILDALRNRRCYSTLDRNCVLAFRVNGAAMGSILQEPVKEVKVEVAVEDTADDATAKLELFEDGAVVQTDEPNAAKRVWEATCKPKPGEHFYFAKVTQKDGHRLWSAPVWVTVPE